MRLTNGWNETTSLFLSSATPTMLLCAVEVRSEPNGSKRRLDGGCRDQSAEYCPLCRTYSEHRGSGKTPCLRIQPSWHHRELPLPLFFRLILKPYKDRRPVLYDRRRSSSLTLRHRCNLYGCPSTSLSCWSCITMPITSLPSLGYSMSSRSISTLKRPLSVILNRLWLKCLVNWGCRMHRRYSRNI